jgi:hypothetical protein
MSYLKNMVNVVSSVKIIPSDTIYIPNPSLLIVSSVTTGGQAGSLIDSGVTTQIRQFTTDGASVNGEINCTTDNFILSSTQAQSGNIVGAGQFIKAGNVANNTTDGTAGAILGIKTPDSSVSNTLLVNNNLFPTGKAVDIRGNGFVSKLGVSVGDIVYNDTDSTATLVTAVKSDEDIQVGTALPTGKNYTIYAANPPQAGPGAVNSGTGAQGCLVYVGTSTSIKQDVDQSAAGTDDPRFVNVKVRTVGGQVITFANFPVGEVLPVQVVQVFASPAIANANLIALW